jgi:hypothetical protein
MPDETFQRPVQKDETSQTLSNNSNNKHSLRFWEEVGISTLHLKPYQGWVGKSRAVAPGDFEQNQSNSLVFPSPASYPLLSFSFFFINLRRFLYDDG